MPSVAFYKGKTRFFDRAVQYWTRGDYSHCELVLGPWQQGTRLCASSSMLDGGVRVKAIDLHPVRWDLIQVPWLDEATAQRWLRAHAGQGYDYAGLLGFVVRPERGGDKRWFCSEAVAAMLGYSDPWRYCPNTLYSALSRTATLAIAR